MGRLRSHPMNREDGTQRSTSTQYSIALRVSLDNVPGVLGRLTTVIGEAGGNIFAIEGFVAKGPLLEREIVVNCASVEHQGQVVEAVEAVEGVELIDWWDRTFRMHEGGKVEVLPLCPVGCLLYTSPSPRDRTRSRMPSSA